jgi:hypothetical protein
MAISRDDALAYVNRDWAALRRVKEQRRAALSRERKSAIVEELRQTAYLRA